MSGLEPHTLYALRVRALNSVGASVSEAQRFRTAPAPPSAPQGLQLQHATPSGLALAWAPPRCDHGAPVTGYQLECARGGRGGGSAAAGGWRLAYQGADLHAQVGKQGARGDGGCSVLLLVNPGPSISKEQLRHLLSSLRPCGPHLPRTLCTPLLP